MRVIRNINNNVALCLDGNGNEVVAFGKGIGFKKPPYDIELNQIQRTYWGIDKINLSMINSISPELLEISDEIVNFARMKLENPVSSNIVFTLADHIGFAIERQRKNMVVRLPIVQDIKCLFGTEMEIGRYALKLLKIKLKIFFDDDEAAYIALHIINAEAMGQDKRKETKQDEVIIQEIVEQIEHDFQIEVNKEGFSYSRFVSHMYYLLRRGKKNQFLQSEDSQLYRTTIDSYPDTYSCVLKIKEYLKQTMQWDMTEEESFYLMLHINRLCDREDCYQ